jgi:hypothetical protein
VSKCYESVFVVTTLGVWLLAAVSWISFFACRSHRRESSLTQTQQSVSPYPESSLKYLAYVSTLSWKPFNTFRDEELVGFNGIKAEKAVRQFPTGRTKAKESIVLLYLDSSDYLSCRILFLRD